MHPKLLVNVFEVSETPPQTGSDVSEDISSESSKSVTPICIEIAFEFTSAALEVKVFPWITIGPVTFDI